MWVSPPAPMSQSLPTSLSSSPSRSCSELAQLAARPREPHLPSPPLHATAVATAGALPHGAPTSTAGRRVVPSPATATAPPGGGYTKPLRTVRGLVWAAGVKPTAGCECGRRANACRGPDGGGGAGGREGTTATSVGTPSASLRGTGTRPDGSPCRGVGPVVGFTSDGGNGTTAAPPATALKKLPSRFRLSDRPEMSSGDDSADVGNMAAACIVGGWARWKAMVTGSSAARLSKSNEMLPVEAGADLGRPLASPASPLAPTCSLPLPQGRVRRCVRPVVGGVGRHTSALVMDAPGVVPPVPAAPSAP